MKKFCLVIVGYLEKYPPILSFLQVANELGYEITVLAAGDNSNIENYPGYNFKGIKHNDVIGEYKTNISLPMKLIRMIKIRNKIWNALSSDELKDCYIIIVSETTIKHIGNRITKRNYILYQLELIEYFNIISNFKLLKKDPYKIGNTAKAVIVCEYNRAHITKTWWRLENLPYIIKNKPYIPSIDFSNIPENVIKIITNVKEKANGRKIIIYQGIIGSERPVDKFITAIREKKNEYLFVVMGDKELIFSNGDVPENYYFIPFIAPPYHLAITRLAYIGILVYKPKSYSSYSNLNSIYCAPNKIWEYSKFGIPMIANDIPALEYELNTNGIGCCTKSLETKDILDTLKLIENSYTIMSQKATRFFNNYNVKDEIEKILSLIK